MELGQHLSHSARLHSLNCCYPWRLLDRPTRPACRVFAYGGASIRQSATGNLTIANQNTWMSRPSPGHPIHTGASPSVYSTTSKLRAMKSGEWLPTTAPSLRRGSAAFGQFAYRLPTGRQKAKRPTFEDWPKCLISLVGRAGSEPATNGLKVRCSTN